MPLSESPNWVNQVDIKLMRPILIDLARLRRYATRGGNAIRITLEALDLPDIHAPDRVILDDVLQVLDVLDPRKSRMLALRFFGGLSAEGTAEVFQVSPGTIHRDWRFANRELTRGQET
jgi:RNA polymerase sigma-70 factor (ECF subfamily)